MEKAEQKVDESCKKWLSNVHACGHGKLSFRRSRVTDGFLLFGSHDLRDRSRTNDSRTRVHRLTNRFNSTFRPTKRTFGCRFYIIVEQKVLFVRRVAQETEQNYRIQGRGRDGARSSFFDFPGTHRKIFLVKRFKVLACHDCHDYYIFLKEGTSVITQRFQCLLSDDPLLPPSSSFFLLARFVAESVFRRAIEFYRRCVTIERRRFSLFTLVL